MIKGVLFDMDGVLVDSESFICRAAVLMFGELGVNVNPEDFHPFVGTGENMYLGGVASKYGLALNIAKAKARVYEIYGEIASGHLYALPGAHEFITRCTSRHLKLALATSADRIKMEINLREIKLSSSLFNSIVTGEDVANKKPFPDIYIMAARNIGLEPGQCLVVEDAVSGIRAGKSAGCRCLAVTSSFGEKELYEADWICGSLSIAPDEALQW
jgi:HAD superfamily hydrolase (TIGR01509 family)